MPRSYYEDDEDDLDIRIHRGRVSPAPMVYEHRRPAPRPYYDHGSEYLVPQTSISRVRRSPSVGHRASPPPPPVVINNNYYDDEVVEEDRYLQLARPVRSHSRSRSRPERPDSYASSATDWELEKTRKELERYKMEERAEKEKEKYKQEMEQYKQEMELKRLKEEKRAKEEKERIKKEADEAVEKFKREEEKKKEKERKEKEEREKEYQHRLEDDLRKSGKFSRILICK